MSIEAGPLSRDLDQHRYEQLKAEMESKKPECQQCHNRFTPPENYRGTPKLCGDCYRRGEFKQ